MYNIPEYHLLSLDARLPKHSGLLMYIHESISFDNITPDIIISETFEVLAIKITKKTKFDKDIIVANIYRQPNDLNSNILKFEEELDTTVNNLNKKKHHIYLAGDYNINLLKIKERKSYEEFFDRMIQNGFLPKITTPTRITDHSKTVIDNIYSNKMDTDEKTCILLNHISDHQACIIGIKNFTAKEKKPKYVQIRNQNQECFEYFANVLQSMNDNGGIIKRNNNDVNECYNQINEALQKAINESFTIKRVRFNKYKHKANGWITDGILRSIKYKDELYKNMIKSTTKPAEYQTRKTNFKTYNKILKKMINEAKRNFYYNQFQLYKQNMKKTWQTINDFIQRKVKSNSFPEKLKIKDLMVTDQQEIANYMNQYYATVASNNVQDLANDENNKAYEKYLTNRPNTVFNFHTVTPLYIENIIKNLKLTNTAGIDNISNKMIKTAVNQLVNPITSVVNLMISTSTFPDLLKRGKLKPIYKKGDKTLAENYRPISILPSISKIFERVLHDQLTNYFEENNLFYQHQYGYRKKHSAELASLEFTDRCTNMLDNKGKPLLIFLDLSKAFDTINHKQLLKKMASYGIGKEAILLIKNYLSINRTQVVEIEKSISKAAKVTTGVPQGSILGPLLFNIFINDFHKCSSIFNFICYADDTTLIVDMKGLGDDNQVSIVINEELAKVVQWIQLNNLKLNITKTKFMRLQYRTTNSKLQLKLMKENIDEIDKFNFLGIVVDKNLNWKAHVHHVCNKIRAAIVIISKVKHIFPQRILHTLYTSLIESHINYGILSWGSNYKKVFLLQKRVLRIISHSNLKAHTEPLFKVLEILKVKDLYNLKLLAFYHNLRNENLPIYFNHLDPIRTRDDTRNYILRNPNITLPRCNLQKTQNAVCYQLPKLLQKLPNVFINLIDNENLCLYRKMFKSFTLNQYETQCNTLNCYVCNL